MLECAIGCQDSLVNVQAWTSFVFIGKAVQGGQSTHWGHVCDVYNVTDCVRLLDIGIKWGEFIV